MSIKYYSFSSSITPTFRSFSLAPLNLWTASWSLTNINVGTELILYSSAVLPRISTSILTNATVGCALLNDSKNGAIFLHGGHYIIIMMMMMILRLY